ncbi:MAG: hypothetical protein JW874_02855 [Spirochaetales bacterium]|nr:hypothetical protein [Spirochaetales bacterium]
MKKRKPIVTMLLFLCSMLYAENPHILYIRKLYGDIMASMKNEYPKISYELITDQIYGGIGEMHTHIQFYHTLIQQDEDYYEPYNRGVEPLLLFVTVDYNIAAGSEEHVEYLYDPETGVLLFCYKTSSTGNNTDKQRWYFLKDALIRIKKDCVDEKFLKEANFTNDETVEADTVMAKAAEYRDTFTRIYYLDRIEKWDE